MNTKLVLLSVFFLLNININFCLAQNEVDSSKVPIVDTRTNKKSFFKKSSKNKRVKYQLSEEEIRLRKAHPDSLSKREKKKLEKSYKKEQKYNEKKGLSNDESDPIRASFMHQNPDYEGMNLTKSDMKTLNRINKKYGLSSEEKELRESNQDTLNLIHRFKIAKSYRKEYVGKKKLQKFWKNKIYAMQAPYVRERMKEHEKKIKKRDRHRKWLMRKKRFLSMFK